MIGENSTCDIKVKCTLNSSFSIIDRHKNICETSTKRPFIKNTDEAEHNYSTAKKRKHSTDYDSGSIEDLIKLEVDDSNNLNGFKSLVSDDLNTSVKCNSPETLTPEMISDDIEIKDEIIDSSPNNYSNDIEQPKLIKDTDTISEKYDKCYSKKNSIVKRSKTKKNENNISVEVEDILEELETIEQNEQISDSDREKLKKLRITLVHKVPPQHEIELYAARRPPTYRQQKLFKKYGPIRKGVFSAQENEIIQKNWKKFCELHNWDTKNVKPFLSFKDKCKFYIKSAEERKKFIQFLANGLPWRTLYSVYWRFKKLNSSYICKRYTPEEDEKILAYVQDTSTNVNKKFSDLAKILNRTRHSVWTHYQRLKKKHKIKKHDISLSQVRWVLPLITRYIKKLLKITKCKDIKELKNAYIPKVVWKKLQKKLNIDYKILKRFWLLQLHMQLFYPNPIYMNDIKIQLIEYMYGKGISDGREIVWSNLVKYFDGMTSTFLNKIFTTLTYECDVIEYRRKSLLDAIEYLYEKKIPEIREQHDDKYLPWIQYTNGIIKVFSEEEMNEFKNGIDSC
ncbi:hypothetical protein KPH14_001649 [Odynerus spinipes]|uniref:Myb-like domain-containing protein n=1 Tax=Odynerus spinipes TaxID=1348599 RepID=A0AAD9VVV6_9HYME|nr:hypothetical protein KPH14_001649 [Odynerus spinipes]